MKRDIWLRWTWIVVAAALACIPAWGQADSCSTDITCWSSIDIDTYGDIAGVSVTEEPYYYYWGGLAAYVEGMLLGDSGYTLIEDVEAEDDGEGYAEADTSGTASDSGDYVQEGFNWIIYLYEDLDPEYLGEAQEDVTWEYCPFPYSETSIYMSPTTDGGFWVGTYYATLSGPFGASFFDRQVQENVVINSESCFARFGDDNDDRFVMVTTATIMGHYVWDSGSLEYGDDGIPDEVGDLGDKLAWYEGNLAGDDYCWDFQGTQQMAMSECYYTTVFDNYGSTDTGGVNTISLKVSAGGVTSYRGAANGAAH